MPVRSSRETRPRGWLLYLGKPHRPWRLPLGEDRSGSPWEKFGAEEAKDWKVQIGHRSSERRKPPLYASCFPTQGDRNALAQLRSARAECLAGLR
jgi:hypothetical protein